MLREAAFTADTCEALQQMIAEQGPTVTNHLGGCRRTRRYGNCGSSGCVWRA